MNWGAITFAETAHALTYQGAVNTVVNTVNQGIVPLLGGAALIFFFWGLVKYLLHSDSEGERKKGRDFMLWGLLGLLVLVGTWGLVGLLSSLLGVDVTLPQFKG